MLKKACILVMVMICVVRIGGCAWGGVSLSAFPDPVFREYLSGYDNGWVEYDSNGREICDAYGNTIYFGKDNGILDDKEIEGITWIWISHENLTSLKGIEYLTALEHLECDGKLTELDLSRNTKLTELRCWRNQLTELDLSHNTKLTELLCDNNQLTKLNLSGHTALKYLRCYENPLIELNLSDCTSLSEFQLTNLPSLKKFTARNCTAMKSLYCECEALTEFDISGCKSLEYLYYTGQKLSKIDLSSCIALESLYCSNSQLTELDLSKNTALKKLDCEYTPITKLDLSHNTALELLFCSNNQLKSLDVSGCAVLESLYCCWGRLTELDVSHCVSLEELQCQGNQLKRLDVSGCSALKHLGCSDNQLTELDLSRNTALLPDYAGNIIVPVDCHNQQSRGIKMKKTSKGYEVNMKDYVSHIENIDADSIYSSFHYGNNPVSYDKKTGIATFREPLTSLKYTYMTHSPEGSNGTEMYVTITNPLSVASLESTYRELWRHGLICGMTENSYLDWDGNHLTESDIEFIWGSQKGLTADGNSRIIIRALTDKPGTVSFSLNDDIGAKLESLSREELTASTNLNTTGTSVAFPEIYQVSAVLVAPERFPESKLIDFPSSTFKVHVKFTDEDGETFEEDLELKIEAAPVVLIHGLRDEGANCFGLTKNTGIWHSLTAAGFRDIRIWNYDGKKGPTEILASDYNGLYFALTDIFSKYAKRGIVCTRADFVCHSMGGLMARKYLDDTDKNLADGNNWSTLSYKQGMVRRVVTVATPHRGSELADIMINGSTNPLLWPVRQLFYGLMNLGGLKTGYIGNSDSALRELMTTAPRAYGFPSDVPMFAIAGDISGNLDELATKITTITESEQLAPMLNILAFSHPELALIMASVAVAGEIGAGLRNIINYGIFNGQGHDLIVSVPSAVIDFDGSQSIYRGMKYMHISVCGQNVIGDEIVNLLKGPVDVFKKFGASAKTAVSKSSPSTKKTASEQMKFIEALNLKIEPSVFTVSDSTSQTVKFSVTASNPTTHDIYCSVEVGNAYKLFKLPDSNDGKNFSAQIVFASQDSGVMNAFCFSHNPNDTEGKSLHISNTVNILALSDVTSANIVSLDFAGKETAYTSVNSETPAGLFAVASDGRYYDVSSPLAGTQWTSTEIARVNDNGCVLGLKEGITTLTATFNGLTASVNVEVSAELIEEEEESTPPEILTESLTNAITAQPYTHQLTASGTTPITWTLKGRLPQGLTLSPSGLISGTPTKAGKFTFTVQAANDYGSDTHKFTLQVLDPANIITASLKPATFGKSYSVTLKAKGSKPLTWSATGLPDGLTINAKTGRISGKPSAHGKFNVKITASNEAGSTEKSLQLAVKGVAPKLSGSLARATINEPYSSGLKLTAGTYPLTWSCTGTLPAGLTFDTSTGKISGTPTSYEKSGFKLTITASNDEGRKSKSVKLNVKAIAPKITVKKLPDAEKGKSYTVTLTATGSTPITWKADGLPEGLYVDGNTIKGTPKVAGDKFTVTLYAENPVKSVKKSLTLKVASSSDTRLPVFSKQDGFTSFTDDVPAHEYSVRNVDTGYVIVAELGEISCDISGMYDFSVTLSDDADIGAELVYMAGSDVPSDDDDIAEFYDETGEEVTCVPESRRITLSVWMNEGVIYSPVIAVKK